VSVVLLGEPGLDVREALAEVGLAVTGVLAQDPFGPEPLAVPAAGTRVYADLPDLARGVADGAVRVVVLPARTPLAAALPEVVALGAAVLLPDPAPWDPGLVREARALADEGDVPVAVLLRERHAGWVQGVRDGIAARPKPLQLAVRGWPRGPAAAAELIDLVRVWCGDIVSCAAAPARMPGQAFTTGEPVSWALLTEQAVTVVVAHAGSLQLRFGFLGLGPIDITPGLPGQGHLGADPALTAVRAVARARALGTSDVLGSTVGRWPWVADLADLQPVVRVLESLRMSARREDWVRLDDAYRR
jgi:hypothetical protein